MAKLGTLVVELAIKIREYLDGVDKAANATEASAVRIVKAEKEMADSAKNVVAGQNEMADTAAQVATRMGPMGGAVAAAAAVVAGYALVSYKAAQENTALVRAMALSGNQAGVTAGQLQGLAGAASQVVGTHGQAVQAIGQMVSGGKVAAENLQALTVTALNAQRTLGLSVADTVARYEELGEAPTKASRKLNEALGYLNAETYRRIQALEDMGKKDEAAALAQLTYAKGVDDATKKVEASLGTLQRTWRSVGEAAGKAWDWMLGLGRKDEVQDQLAGLRRQLEEKERQLANGSGFTMREGPNGLRQMVGISRDDLLAEADALREQLSLLSRAGLIAAQNAADSVKWNNAKMEALDRNRAAEKSLMTQAERRAEAIREADKDLRMGYISATEHATRVAAAEKQFADQVRKGNDGERERLALLKERQRGLDDLVKSILEREKAEHAADMAGAKGLADAVDRADKAAASVADQLEKQLALNAAMGLSKEAVAELEAAKLEETAATKLRLAALADEIDWSGRMGDAYRDEAAALYALAKAKREGAAKQAGLDADKDAQRGLKAYEREGLRVAERLEQSLTDSLMRGFESGKSLARNLADTVVNMFKTMVLRPTVQAFVQTGLNAVGLGVPGGQGGGLGGNLFGTASNLSSAYDALNNGVSNAVSAGFGKLASGSLGQSLGLSVEAAGPSLPGASAPTQLTSTGQAWAGYAGMAGNALAGYGLQKAISGGYKTGESGLVDAITVAASAYFGPIAGVAAGAFNRAFGRKLTDQGLQGQFGGEAGFTGENYQFLKGGWFRSDKTKTSALDADMQAGLANQFKALQVQTALMATVLGDTGQSVADFTSSIKLSFNGLTEAQIGEKLTETFTGLANDLANAVLGDSAFAKEGEAASQTLQRLANSLTTVNGSFGVLGFGLKAVSLAGADAASDFIDLVGGLEAFTAATAGYYANYYTEAERQSKATEQLTAQLAALGQTLPATRESFRALVESAEAAGNTALLAGLLQLQDEFAALVPATSAAAAAVANLSDTLASSYSDAYAEYADSVRSARALAAEQAQVYASLLDDARSFLGGISTTVREWLDARNATTGNPTANLASSQAAFQRQLALAQGGDRDALGSITQYADRLISAGEQRLGYLQGQQLIASVMSQVKGLPDQVSAEQLIVKAINTTGSATVGAVDGLASNALTTELTVTARSEILKTISYVADTDRLPDDLKALALGTTSDLRKTISYVVGADLPQDLKQLALQGTTHVSKTIRLTAESILNPEMQTLALQGNQTVGKAIDLVVRSALTPELQALALQQTGEARKLIDIVATTAMPDDLRALALQLSGTAAKTISLLATSTLTTEQAHLALMTNEAASKTILLAASSHTLTEEQKRLAFLGSETVQRTIGITASSSLSPEQRILALRGSDAVARVIQLAATNLLDTEDQRLALINSGSVSRAIELAAGRMDTAALSVLSAQSDLVRRTVEAAGGDLTADQRLLLDGSTTLAKMIEVGVDGTAINAFLQTLKSLPPITIPFVGTINVGSVLEHASTGGNADLSRLASINAYVNTLDWVSNKVGSTQALYATAQAYGVSQADIAAATGYNLADIRALFDAASIPAFATGAAFGGGIVSRPTMFPMGLMGEKDPEAIMPLANIGGSLGVRYAGPDFSQFGRGMEAMAAEIRRLNDKNDRLEALFRSVVVNSADSADTLRSIKNNGLEVFNTPTEPLHTQAVAP